jgi:16S rRNA (guanine527-N7)-methyltransferase
MNITEFAKIIKSGPVQDITEEQIDKLYRHMNMVLEKNRVMNLTSIEDPYEFVVKHILDSLTAAEYVKDCRTIIDVGTGAGFPGMPLKLLYPDKEVTFLDSTAKKVEFIRECGSALSVEPARYVHGRAEDIGHLPEYRGKFDCAVARAVASLPVLAEYCIPLLKKGGIFVAMKSSNVDEELDSCKNALSELRSTFVRCDRFFLTNTDIARSIVVFQLTGTVPEKYPRKAGLPSKKPL